MQIIMIGFTTYGYPVYLMGDNVVCDTGAGVFEYTADAYGEVM